MGKSPELPFEAEEIQYVPCEFEHPHDSPVEEIDYIFSDDEQTYLYEFRAISGWPLPNPIAISTNPAVRFENYLSEKIRAKGIEKIKEKFPYGNPDAKREDFGEGKAGDWAYQTIKNGAECVTFIDDDKNKCGELAYGTVDVDINSNLDLFPYCTIEHAIKLTEQLVTEIESNGDSTTPSRNGFGRELASSEVPVVNFGPEVA